MAEFFRVIPPDQLVAMLGSFSRLPIERVSLDASLNRIAAENIISIEDLPEGARSTVDGFAVRAEDTFGASNSNPAMLKVIASVPMGTIPDFQLNNGEAASIPTGGFLPKGADAVVMIEHTNDAGEDSIEVNKPATARSNVVEKGEDARSGEILIAAGKKIRPQEIGFLAAFGAASITVRKQPRVAVISSGDEVVPIEFKPSPGKIRDANAHSISALARSMGCNPINFDIVPDNAAKLSATIREALEQADVVTLSGGSSVGTRDLMVDVVSSIPDVEVLAHGVAIRPGKPTLLANRKGKAIIGLPGHPVSALVVAHVFLAPLLEYLQGAALRKGPLGYKTEATLGASIHSTIGLEEYIRVRLEETDDGAFVAFPVHGKSGMLSTMVKADAMIAIPMNTEGFSKGESVQATYFNI